MAEIDCTICEELKDTSVEFISQGITDNICTSLANDTGLNPELPVLHTDCEDLDVMNDCLIGRPADELEKYDVCEWKKFMRKYIGNLYTMFKGLVCAVCGLWTNIHNLWKRLAKAENDLADLINRIDHLECMITALTTTQEIQFDVGEFIAGTDVYFRSSGSVAIGVSFDVIGNMGVLNASVGFNDNSKWLTELGHTSPGDEGWLVCELHINKAATGIRHIYAADSQTINTGCYLASVYGFDGDRDFNTYGRARRGIYSNQTPEQWGWQDGSRNVPPGWIYLQLRVNNIMAVHSGVSFFANVVVVRDADIVCPED